MSVLFGFDRSCAHDWVHRLLPILETALGKKQALPERKIDSIEEFTAITDQTNYKKKFKSVAKQHF